MSHDVVSVVTASVTVVSVAEVSFAVVSVTMSDVIVVSVKVTLICLFCLIDWLAGCKFV